MFPLDRTMGHDNWTSEQQDLHQPTALNQTPFNGCNYSNVEKDSFEFDFI